MIATQLKPVADRPWLDPSAKPQIVIDGVVKIVRQLHRRR